MTQGAFSASATSTTVAPTVSYISSAFMENAGPFPTFSAALRDFIERVKKVVSEKGASLMMLEQGSWIERRNNVGGKMTIGFYDARDFGYATGLLAGRECEFQDGVAEPDPGLVSDLYTAVMATGTGETFINRLRETRS